MTDKASEYLNDLITLAEAAELLRTTEAALRHWVKQGKVRAYALSPRQLVFRKSELEAFLISAATNSQRMKPTKPPVEGAYP